MNRLYWTLRYACHCCSGFGLVGFCLILGASLALFGGIRPERAAQSMRLTSLTALIDDSARLENDAARVHADTASQSMPAAATYTNFLRKNAELALLHSIALTEIDFTSRPEAGQRLVRHTLRYAIDGNYPALREYLDAVERLPGARVESVSFVRSGDQRGAVNALVNLSYLVETAS
nr:hypothetical protein [uncultured Cupriavidus sp.]